MTDTFANNFDQVKGSDRGSMFGDARNTLLFLGTIFSIGGTSLPPRKAHADRNLTEHKP